MPSPEEYAKYLLSQEWAHLRQDAFKLHGDACLACGSYLEVQLHHIYYPRDIRASEPEHVMPLCERCHGQAHCMVEKPYTWNYAKFGETWDRVLRGLKDAGYVKTFRSNTADAARIEALKRRAVEHENFLAAQRRSRRKPVPNRQQHKAERKRLEKLAKSLSPGGRLRFFKMSDERLAALIQKLQAGQSGTGLPPPGRG